MVRCTVPPLPSMVAQPTEPSRKARPFKRRKLLVGSIFSHTKTSNSSPSFSGRKVVHALAERRSVRVVELFTSLSNGFGCLFGTVLEMLKFGAYASKRGLKVDPLLLHEDHAIAAGGRSPSNGPVPHRATLHTDLCLTQRSSAQDESTSRIN